LGRGPGEGRRVAEDESLKGCLAVGKAGIVELAQAQHEDDGHYDASEECGPGQVLVVFERERHEKHDEEHEEEEERSLVVGGSLSMMSMSALRIWLLTENRRGEGLLG
jgi:hypothetical protein